jgi:hypothetical protein
VRVWVGTENAIKEPLPYILAGGAIFWLGAARLPAVFAYGTVQLGQLIKVAGIEVICKVLLTFLLYPRMGFVAPLAAINAVHLGGIFLLYRRIIR